MHRDGYQPLPITKEGSGIDFVLKTASVDQVEQVLQTLAPHKLFPLERAKIANAGAGYHGAWDFGVFDLKYGVNMKANTGAHAADRVGIMMAAGGTGLIDLRGDELVLSQKQAAVFESGPGLTVHFPEDLVCQILFLSMSKLENHCSRLLDRPIEKPLALGKQMLFDTPQGNEWKTMISYATHELRNPTSFTRTISSVRDQLENMLISAFLFGHQHNYSDALLRPQSAAAPFYVKRAEEYIEARFTEPLSLADIAAHAGVSARSLQNGFQNFRKMTPMAFLRQTRLQHAHRMLTLADPSTTTVTEIALASGFGHLGEFAALYKRHYGVTPKETLIRAGRH